MLGYILFGASRFIVDGLRVIVFISGCALAGAMLRYARSLWNYAEGVEWRGSPMDWTRRWVEHNQRLMGRFTLCLTWVGMMAYIVGTEIKDFGQDMGYWHLPVGLVTIVVSIIAVSLLMNWNSLNRD